MGGISKAQRVRQGAPLLSAAAAFALAFTAAAAGLIFMLQRQASWLVEWETYAVALAAVGLFNPVWSRAARPSPARGR